MIVSMLFVLLFVCSYVHVTSQSIVDKPSDVVTYESLRLAYKQLVSYYRNISGYFGEVDSFWTSANSIEALSNYYIVSKQVSQFDDLSEIEFIFENTHTKMKPFYFSYGRCYDDYLWWVLAWKRAYDATSNEMYLEQSKIIFHRLVDTFAIWNTTCGGVVWSAASQYRNAITNELFLDASTQLAQAANSSAEELYYLSWVHKEINWFLSTKMISTPPLAPEGTQVVDDGLPGGTCANDIDPTGLYWTYNSGVLLDGLAHNGQVDLALNISQSAITYFTDPVAGDRIMRELSCSAPEGICDGQDGKMFKGAFVRHLHYMMKILYKKSSKLHNYEVVLKEYQDWIILQAHSILTKASLSVTSESSSPTTPTGLLLSQQWQGPPPELPENPRVLVKTTPWVSQTSALEALTAAFSLLNNVSYAM